MIQINLVPDIKQEFLRAQATKRLVLTFSFLISAGFLVLTGILFMSVNVFQQGHIDDLDADISTAINTYQNLEDVSEVLTVNNQLTVLPSLHQQKPALTRLPGYLTKLIPDDISISDLQISTSDGTISLSGFGPSFEKIQQFANTLKAAVFYEKGGDVVSPVFELVVVDRQGTSDDEDKNKRASYSIRATFNLEIFDNSKEIILTVPTTTSDDTELLSPEDLIDISSDGDDGDTSREDDLFQGENPEEESQ